MGGVYFWLICFELCRGFVGVERGFCDVEDKIFQDLLRVSDFLETQELHSYRCINWESAGMTCR